MCCTELTNSELGFLMFNPSKKKQDDHYQFDPASYVIMARKIITEHEKSQSNSKSNLVYSQPKKIIDSKDLYAKFFINRIL